MKLSMKSDYALRALFTLVDTYETGKPISIRELAQRNDVPKRYLEQIMLEMKNAGWVLSVPGRDGGFILAKRPEEITMGEIVRHFDGILAPIACVSSSHYEPCSQEPNCRFRRVFLDVRNYTTRVMDRADLTTVSQGEPVTRREVFEEAFTFGDGGGI